MPNTTKESNAITYSSKKIWNYYWTLIIKEEDWKHYWWVENYNWIYWQEISEKTFEVIREEFSKEVID